MYRLLLLIRKAFNCEHGENARQLSLWPRIRLPIDPIRILVYPVSIYVEIGINYFPELVRQGELTHVGPILMVILWLNCKRFQCSKMWFLWLGGEIELVEVQLGSFFVEVRLVQSWVQDVAWIVWYVMLMMAQFLQIFLQLLLIMRNHASLSLGRWSRLSFLSIFVCVIGILAYGLRPVFFNSTVDLAKINLLMMSWGKVFPPNLHLLTVLA